jgi:hypothetical protein
MEKSIECMIKYLVKNTRYTKEELESMKENTIRKFYREEREVDKPEEMQNVLHNFYK